MAAELFELELLGGGVERRYRRLRPELDALPWGSLDLRPFDERTLLAARGSWTLAAFQEYRSAVVCAASAQALMEAGAPLDLSALLCHFQLDELTHAELCARMAMELGGAVPLYFERAELVPRTDPARPPLLRALELIVSAFCVGETVSLPVVRILRGLRSVPLARAIWGHIARDESAHGAFGWIVLDWALPALDAAGREHLGRTATRTMAALAREARRDIDRGVAVVSPIDPLAWLGTRTGAESVLALLAGRITDELRARDIRVG